MAEIKTLTVRAYPEGTEMWVVDATEVRRVVVRDVTVRSRDMERAEVIHYIEPIDGLKDNVHPSMDKRLMWDTARLVDLHETEEAAIAARNERVRQIMRTAEPEDPASSPAP